MTFKDGDFLEIDYSMWDATDNSLVATTEEQKAKNGGIYNKDTRYGPTLVVLGANNVISGLDKALHSMSVNEQKKFTFKPEEAFGERNEEFVRVMPIAGFRKNDIVIGIMGKTQGVKMAASPKPKARRRKDPSP